MLLKIVSKRSLLLVVLSGAAFALPLLFYAVSWDLPQAKPAPVVTEAVVVPKQKPSRAALPVRLTIPKIQVDAVIEALGITAEGAMDVPKDPNHTGWYELGARPGEVGSAVIDGHLDWYNGKTAVFTDLHKVQVGDSVIVYDAKGSPTSFVVRRIQEYDAAADATAIFTSKDGLAHLNLITCQGAWDKAKDSYAKRLIVFTDMVK